MFWSCWDDRRHYRPAAPPQYPVARQTIGSWQVRQYRGKWGGRSLASRACAVLFYADDWAWTERPLYDALAQGVQLVEPMEWHADAAALASRLANALRSWRKTWSSSAPLKRVAGARGTEPADLRAERAAIRAVSLPMLPAWIPKPSNTPAQRAYRQLEQITRHIAEAHYGWVCSVFMTEQRMEGPRLHTARFAYRDALRYAERMSHRLDEWRQAAPAWRDIAASLPRPDLPPGASAEWTGSGIVIHTHAPRSG